MLPEVLQTAINTEVQSFEFADLKDARFKLTDSYRHQKQKNQNFITSDAQRCSYLITRLPATYAVVSYVLQEIQKRLPHVIIRGLLDLGAGPGTVMWAACEVFDQIATIHQVEQDKQLIALGKRLSLHSPNQVIAKSNWLPHNLENLTVSTLPIQDLVVLSYSIGELSPQHLESTLKMSWDCAQEVLVVIEPGTPVGFERIRKIRTQLIDLGAHIVAPCPHAQKCPMVDGDWCHFSQRIARTSMHRQMKEGTLGHEDEKFSYIIASKKTPSSYSSRILRHPLKRSGHVIMTLCTDEGIKQETISKRDAIRYKQARHADWGEDFIV